MGLSGADILGHRQILPGQTSWCGIYLYLGRHPGDESGLVCRTDVIGRGSTLLGLTPRGRIGPFCGGLTVAVLAHPAAVDAVVPPVTDAVVALDVKCINKKISVDYQQYKNRIYMSSVLS